MFGVGTLGLTVLTGRGYGPRTMKTFSFVAIALLTAASSTRAADSDPATPRYNSRSLPIFSAKVQPVLMNLCARCHCHPEHESSFKLRRVRPGFADPQAAAINLPVAVRFLDPQDLASSPLLTMTLTAHGGLKEPPLQSRTHPAFKNLEYWASLAVSPDGSAVAVVPTIKPIAIVPVAAAKPIEPTPIAPADTPKVPASDEPMRLPMLTTSTLIDPASARDPKPNPNDPFDPAVFNTLPK